MTPTQIAEWAIKGDFPRGESERLGIARVVQWIEQALNAAVEAQREADAKIAREVAEGIKDDSVGRYQILTARIIEERIMARCNTSATELRNT